MTDLTISQTGWDLIWQDPIGWFLALPLVGQILTIIVVILLAIAAIILVLASLKIAYDNWRCPKCNDYMGIVWNPKFCAKCGERLR